MVIQRVQTLYLLLALVCSVVFLFIPFGYNAETGLVPLDFAGIWIPAAGAGLLSLIDIFLFKSAGAQKGLIVVAALALVVSAVMMFVKVAGAALSLGGGGLLLAASLIGLTAAYRGISADQKLLQSYDRIR